MAAKNTTNDKLTENGILTDHPEITRLDMDRSDLSQRMHELAREHGPADGIGHWPADDPVVFDARTFDEGDR